MVSYVCIKHIFLSIYLFHTSLSLSFSLSLSLSFFLRKSDEAAAVSASMVVTALIYIFNGQLIIHMILYFVCKEILVFFLTFVVTGRQKAVGYMILKS